MLLSVHIKRLQLVLKSLCFLLTTVSAKVQLPISVETSILVRTVILGSILATTERLMMLICREVDIGVHLVLPENRGLLVSQLVLDW